MLDKKVIIVQNMLEIKTYMYTGKYKCEMATGVSNKIHVRPNNISLYNMLQCTEISSKN